MLEPRRYNLADLVGLTPRFAGTQQHERYAGLQASLKEPADGGRAIKAQGHHQLVDLLEHPRGHARRPSDLGPYAAAPVCAFSALFLVNQNARPVQASRRATSALDLVDPAGSVAVAGGRKQAGAHGNGASSLLAFTFRASRGAPCTNALLDMRGFPPGPAAMAQHIHSPQSDPRASADSAGPVVYTVAEFCSAHKISRSKLYQLWRAGTGPRSIKIGSRNLITAESASEWRRQLEGGGLSSSS